MTDRIRILDNQVKRLEWEIVTLTKSLTRAWNFLAWTQIILGVSVVALGAGLLAVTPR